MQLVIDSSMLDLRAGLGPPVACSARYLRVCLHATHLLPICDVLTWDAHRPRIQRRARCWHVIVLRSFQTRCNLRWEGDANTNFLHRHSALETHHREKSKLLELIATRHLPV